jgi:uncharacterized damage-inducible protein DinB
MIRPVRARRREYFGRIRDRIRPARGIPRHCGDACAPRDPALDCGRFFSRAETACGEKECRPGDRTDGARRQKTAQKPAKASHGVSLTGVLFFRTEVSMTISEILLPEFDQEMASTRKILDCVPEDKFAWKPHAKSMSLDRLASHVADLPNWGSCIINQDSLDLMPGMKPFIAETKAELMEALDKNVAATRDAIAGAGDEHLGKIWTFSFAGHTVFALPRTAALRSAVMSHLIHHRGQLSVYLRLLDVAIPGMYGPSADDR